MPDLLFVPRGFSLVPLPGHIPTHGGQPRRVCASVKLDRWQISPRPHAVKPESREAMLLVRMCQRGDLAPYDAATASACGVAFEPLEWADGDRGWLPATRKRRSSTEG